MQVPTINQRRVAEALVAHCAPLGTGIQIDDALDRCRVSDVEQIAWELDQVGVTVSARALLAMALSRAVSHQIAEEFVLKEQLRQAELAVTRTGDKQAPAESSPAAEPQEGGPF